jgi:protein SDA1
MGLNVLREMCNKNHLIMDEFHLNYLAEYRDYKNKNVSSAAKSIINLFREVNPKLLQKKYQGRRLEEALAANPSEKYGEDRVGETIDGAEALGESANIFFF